MNDGAPLAAASGLVVRRGGRVALGPLDLRIEPREFWGVVGPNGAGKSTLMLTLAGLLKPDAGSVEVLGRGLDGSGRARRRLGGAVGLLFQKHDFVPDMPFSVEDVVLFGRAGRGRIGGGGDDEDRRAAERALELLGLADARRRLYRSLSGGERRKVQLARLVAQRAPLTLLDEPTAGLDIEWQERLTQLVAQLHAEMGGAIVMVTHDVDRLPSCCDRALLLGQGRAAACGRPEEVFTADALGGVFGCPMYVAHRHGRFFAHALGVAEER